MSANPMSFFLLAFVVLVFNGAISKARKKQEEAQEKLIAKAVVEAKRTPFIGIQPEITPQASGPSVSADLITDQLNADPSTVIPFRGPTLKTPGHEQVEPDLWISADPAPGPDLDPDLYLTAAADNDGQSLEISREEENWRFYDEPTIFRQNPSWEPKEIDRPAEIVFEPMAEGDLAELQEYWEDYAVMMRNADGDLIPLSKKSEQRQELSFH